VHGVSSVAAVVRCGGKRNPTHSRRTRGRSVAEGVMRTVRGTSPTVLVRSILTVIFVMALAPPLPACAQNFLRLEVHPVATQTLTGEQFLTGDKAGRPTLIAGELRIPKPGTDRLPTVLLVHGSGGISASANRWAWELNEAGLSTFILDSF